MSEPPPGVGLAWSGMADDVVVVEHGSRRDRFTASATPCGSRAGRARRPDAFHRSGSTSRSSHPQYAWPLMDGDNPMSEGAARRRDRFDSLDQAYVMSKKPAARPAASRRSPAYVQGGVRTHNTRPGHACTAPALH